MKNRPRLTLCAAITFDGKLTPAKSLPPTLLRALAFDAGEVLLMDDAPLGKLPPEWNRHTRAIGPAGMDDLRKTLTPSPNEPPVRRWLCVGGPTLFRALLDARLVDDLCLLVRPCVDGRANGATLSGLSNSEFFPASIPCRLRRMEIDGGECFLHYTVQRSQA